MRVRAERGAWRTELETCRWLQSVGYLPVVAPALRAHVTHALDGLAVEDLSREVLEMEAAWREVRPQDQVAAAMSALRRQLPGQTGDGAGEGAAGGAAGAAP